MSHAAGLTAVCGHIPWLSAQLAVSVVQAPGAGPAIRITEAGLAVPPVFSTIIIATQVLAGAGPAVAAVPLVVVWAGGSAVSLARGIVGGQVGVMGTASRIGFVSGQSIAQVLQYCQVLLLLYCAVSADHSGARHRRLPVISNALLT